MQTRFRDGSAFADVGSPRRRASLRDVISPIACLLIVFAGYVKGNSLLSWVPLDLTILASLTVVIGVLGILLRQGLEFKLSPWALFLLALLLLVFVLAPPTNEYGRSKVVGMIVTLIAVVGTIYLVRTAVRQRVWAWSFVGAGFFLAVGLWLAPSR